MKRIVISMLVAACACFANAAAVNWSASGVCDPVASASAGKASPASGWLGYIVLASDYTTVSTDLAAGDTSSLVAKAIGGASVSSSKGAFALGAPAGNVAAGSQQFYLIVLNSGTLDGATGFYSATATVTVDASLDTAIAFGSQATASRNAASWTAVPQGDVPEPTSGLLLLLGGAMLALRRKRA